MDENFISFAFLESISGVQMLESKELYMPDIHHRLGSTFVDETTL